MTKAPERIWAWRDVDRSGWGSAYCSATISSGTEYVRADLLQAAVAAECEACAGVVDNRKSILEVGSELSDRIRARTADDAQAALERVKSEARNEALREAAELAFEAGDFYLARHAIPALITEDQSDE